MEDKKAEAPVTNRKITRRDFLKLSGAAAAGAAAGYAARRFGLRPDSPEVTPSPEAELKPSVRVLDFLDIDKTWDKYLRDNFPPDFSEGKTWQEMGVSDPSNREDLLVAIPKNENQAKLLMMMLFKHQYQNHGEDVVAVMRKVADYLNPDQAVTTPPQASIAGAIEFGTLESDELGNPTIQVRLLPEVVDGLISQSPESVVNMSFEPGDNSFIYKMYRHPERNKPKKQKGPNLLDSEGNIINEGETNYYDNLGNKISEEEYNRLLSEAENLPPLLLSPKDRYIDFVDGYFGEHTEENVRMLAQIAQNHPEKIFVAAGGTPTGMWEIPDILDIRSELEETGLWPSNLIVVGYETSIPDVFTGLASYGADVYISEKDLEELGFSQASSYATPVVSEIIRRTIAHGLSTHQKAKDALFQMTETKKGWRYGSEEIEYRLLSLDKAKESLTTRVG